MKKLFYLLLALPLVFAACEPQPTPGPEPEPEVKDPVLTLTSESEMEFDIDGEGVITYTLENAPEGALPSATCEAGWVYDIVVTEGKIKFSVSFPEPYLFEDDQTKIKVEYEKESFEVTIKRLANAQVPSDEPVELVYLDGTYYEPGYWDPAYTAHNFYVMLASVDDASTYQPNASYLQLDIWAASGDAANPVIPAGEYVFDTNDTCAAGTIGCYYSALVITDGSAQPVTEVYPLEGKVVVSDNKIEVNFVDTYGDAYSFVYNGTPALPVVVQEPVVIDGTGYYATVSNYGDFYEVGANNYYFTLVEDAATFSGNYLTFDLLVDPSKADYTGEYTVLMDVNDAMGKFIPGNISGGYLNGSWYAVVENGSLTNVYQPLYGGTITIAKNADSSITFTLDCVDDKGNPITGSITTNVEEVDPDAMALSADRKPSRFASLTRKSVR